MKNPFTPRVTVSITAYTGDPSLDPATTRIATCSNSQAPESGRGDTCRLVFGVSRTPVSGQASLDIISIKTEDGPCESRGHARALLAAALEEVHASSATPTVTVRSVTPFTPAGQRFFTRIETWLARRPRRAVLVMSDQDRTDALLPY